MTSITQELPDVKQFTCPTSHNPVTPISIIEQSGLVWFCCNDPIHTFDGVQELDLHMVPMSSDELQAIVRRTVQS